MWFADLGLCQLNSTRQSTSLNSLRFFTRNQLHHEVLYPSHHQRSRCRSYNLARLRSGRINLTSPPGRNSELPYVKARRLSASPSLSAFLTLKLPSPPCTPSSQKGTASPTRGSGASTSSMGLLPQLTISSTPMSGISSISLSVMLSLYTMVLGYLAGKLPFYSGLR